MVTLKPLISQFTVVGRLEDLVIKSNGRVKSLLLSIEQEEHWLEVSKNQPTTLGQKLELGCSLRVSGMRKYKLHADQVEYKAYTIEILTKETISCDAQKITPAATTKVLFCGQPNCWQRGGKEACQMLKAQLKQQGMTEQVEIKTTGCLKKCKQAPNMLVLNDGNDSSKIDLTQLPLLSNQHSAYIYSK